MRVSSITDTNQRDQNEDNRLILPKKIGSRKILLAAVFDGMGGTEAGEIASQIARDRFEQWFAEDIENAMRDFPAGTKDEMSALLSVINKDVYEYEIDKGLSSGTTAAVILINGDEYIAANIGDSRIYKFSSKNIQITKDQTVAQLEVDRGNLTPEEALTDKRSHTLLQSLGQEDDPEPDFFKGKCKKGDAFLVCSDGMYNRVSIDQMGDIIKDKDLGTKEKLTEIAILSKSEGEHDNITGILIEM